MDERRKDTEGKPIAMLAHVISDVLSPLLLPVYGMIIALWATPLRHLALDVRLWSTAGVAFITAAVPFLFIFFMFKLGKVNNMSISDPKQRTIPFSVTIVCYIAAALFLFSLHAPTWLVVFYAGAALVTLLTMIITFRWKISAHTGCVGGLAAIIFWLVQHGLISTAPLVWLSTVAVAAGIVAWSRLYLNHHSATQVFAGVVMGFTIEYFLINTIA